MAAQCTAWIGPRGQVADCNAADQSHSDYVMTRAADFGLSNAELTALRDFWDNHDVEEFDYDYIVALGEQAGWVRMSGDGAGDLAVMVSGATASALHRAVRWLTENGYSVEGLELDRINGHAITTRYFQFDSAVLDGFITKRQLPLPTATNTRPVVLP